MLAQAPLMQLELDWPSEKTLSACQRWRDGQSRWRPAGELIDPARYAVRAICEGDAKSFVLAQHYSGTYPAARLRYGLFEDGTRLAGVAVFSVPVRAEVLSGPFPTLRPYDQSLELGRFVLLDSVAGNGETFFLARAFRLAKAAGVRGIVSFSDPLARTDSEGRVIFRGHRGTIYLAANCVRGGRSSARTLTLLPDGSVLSARAISKLRQRERGHDYVTRLLMQHGAGAPPESADDAQHARWVADALVAARTRSLRHPGNHRFLFPLDKEHRARLGSAASSRSRPSLLA